MHTPNHQVAGSSNLAGEVDLKVTLCQSVNEVLFLWWLWWKCPVYFNHRVTSSARLLCNPHASICAASTWWFNQEFHLVHHLVIKLKHLLQRWTTSAGTHCKKNNNKYIFKKTQQQWILSTAGPWMHHGNPSKNKELHRKKYCKQVALFVTVFSLYEVVWAGQPFMCLCAHARAHTHEPVYKHAVADLHSTTWLVESRLDI